MKLEDYQPGPLAEVSSATVDGNPALIFVREFQYPPEKVWPALIESGKTEKWAPFKFEKDLEATGPTTIFVTDGSEPGVIQSEVIQFVPNQVLEFTWAEGHSLLWELAATESGTRLTLTHTVPVSDQEMIDLYASGWHICMDLVELMIQDYIIGPIVGELAWKYVEMVRDKYRQKLGMDEDAD